VEALSTELEAAEGLSTEVVEVAARCTEVAEVVGGLGDLSLCLRRRL